MDGQVGQAEQRVGKAHQSRRETVGRAHMDAPGQRQVTIGEGSEDGAAIHLDAEPYHAAYFLGRPRLDAQPRRIGMGADDAQAAFRQCGTADDEGDDGRVTTHDVAFVTSLQCSPLGFVQACEAGRLQALFAGGDGMPRTGAGIDEIEQILGLLAGVGGNGHGWFGLSSSMSRRATRRS